MFFVIGSEGTGLCTEDKQMPVDELDATLRLVYMRLFFLLIPVYHLCRDPLSYSRIKWAFFWLHFTCFQHNIR